MTAPVLLAAEGEHDRAGGPQLSRKGVTKRGDKWGALGALDYPSVREQLDEHDREEEEEALFRAEEEDCRRTGRRRLLSPAEGRRREPSGLRSEDSD